ncbi:hypothetical protein TCSYLVIO_007829 [Trypanosoma cruzi]|nr:hypothetical protein TCSYLVIO_007829 [Trypanosoma cruzi]
MRHPNLARGIPCRRQGVVLEGIPGGKEVAHTARQALVGVARAVFLVCRQTSGIESRHSAQIQCDSCPFFDRPARALRITSNSLCRWCSTHTEETGPPRLPPEPPPGVSTAPPRRTTSSGSTSPCPSCCSVFSSVHNMKAHARRTNPGTPIVAEGLTCGFCDSSTVSPTSASRAGHHQKYQTYQRAKDGQRTSASSNDSRSPSAIPLLQPPPAAEPRQSTGGPAAHAVGMPRPRQLSIRPFGNTLSHESTIQDGKAGHIATDSPQAINEQWLQSITKQILPFSQHRKTSPSHSQ